MKKLLNYGIFKNNKIIKKLFLDMGYNFLKYKLSKEINIAC